MFKEELHDLNIFYNKKFVLESTYGDILAEKPASIKINYDKINGYLSNKNSDDARLPIRLIVTHEFIHLLQSDFRHMYQQRILEAQADLLAARYTIVKLYRDSISKFTTIGDLDFNQSRFIELCSFFKIGTNTFENDVHPTKFQRASCIYRGLRYCRLELLLSHKNNKIILPDGLISKSSYSSNIDENYNLGIVADQVIYD